ncbi:MAG: ECF-type sigma factor, partial [Acidobacteriota bacterium]
MPSPQSEDLIDILTSASKGDQEALARLMPLVYDELHRLAEQCLRYERPDHTLQATALVHEAYLKLIEQRNISWQNRAHLLAIAAQIMRRILIDYARTHGAVKRGGRCHKLSLNEAIELPDSK